MHLTELPNAVVAGIVLAGLYVLVGLGWVLLFRATKILNFATGQLILLGAYVYFSATTQWHLPALAGVAVTLVVMMALGGAIHVIAVRPLSGAQKFFAPVILTLGISTIIGQSISLGYGTSARTVELPVGNTPLKLPFHIAITASGLVILGVAMVVLCLAIVVVRRSRWGIQMRAAAENMILASQSGINVDRVFMGGWAGTCAALAIVGITYGYSTIVTPSLADIGLRGLACAIVGGFDSLGGLVPGAIIVALTENISVVYFGESVRDAAVMIVILIVIAIKPSGLLGTRSIERV